MYNLTKIHEINQLYRRTSIVALKELKKHTFKRLSTQIAVKDETPETQLMKDIKDISSVKTKEIQKKPQKPPFAKNLFLGVYDTDVLCYPEILEKNDVEELESDVRAVQDFLHEENTNRKLTRYYLESLRKSKLIGLQASSFVGGRQLSITESCRFNESIAENTSCTSVIANEQLGVQILLKNGSIEQQNKYLQALMSGKTVAALCVSEATSRDARNLDTKATLTKDGKMWVLNGEKTWIVNGDTADLLIVLAQTEILNEKGLKDTKTTVFLVERQFGGVTSKPCETLGLQATDISTVTFENTPVPVENVLGDINKGDGVIYSVLPEFRLSYGPVCSTLLRKVLNKFTNHCIQCDSTKINLLSSEAVQYKIGELTASLYAIESITYLTASLIDQYENQDCELESLIVKVFSAEQCHRCILKVMEFIGTPTYLKDNWCNELYCNGLGHLLLNESADSLKIVVALLGLQHAGMKLNGTIKELRNPLFYPTTIFKTMWTKRKHIEDKPSLTLHLHEYLHPSATNLAQFLEYCVLRLQFATETLLAREGPDVINKHIDLHRLANCVIDIYAMTAVLGRASRSYCTGLQNGDFEMNIATAFCVSAKERVKENVKKIVLGPYHTADEKYTKIAEKVIQSREYFPVHPLTRNY